jgi:uncharacterized protein DUF6916
MPGVTAALPSQARFQAALDTVFEIRPLSGAAAPIEARLIDVKALRAPEGCEQFSAIFVGPGTPRYPEQGTYRFVHPALGELDLFMVPIGPGRMGMQYEVCVTRDVPGTDASRR